MSDPSHTSEFVTVGTLVGDADDDAAVPSFPPAEGPLVGPTGVGSGLPLPLAGGGGGGTSTPTAMNKGSPTACSLPCTTQSPFLWCQSAFVRALAQCDWGGVLSGTGDTCESSCNSVGNGVLSGTGDARGVKLQQCR